MSLSAGGNCQRKEQGSYTVADQVALAVYDTAGQPVRFRPLVRFLILQENWEDKWWGEGS